MENKNLFTPGDWELGLVHGNECFVDIGTINRGALATVVISMDDRTEQEELRSNARLIVEAKNMYTLLKHYAAMAKDDRSEDFMYEIHNINALLQRIETDKVIQNEDTLL